MTNEERKEAVEWFKAHSRIGNKAQGDLISRKTVIHNLAQIAKVEARSDAQMALMGRCIFMVEKMPSAQPDIDVPDIDAGECKECQYYINPDYTRCHECGKGGDT